MPNSKANARTAFHIILTIVVFGGTALGFLSWFNSNPYDAFYNGIILVPLWGICLVIWLSMIGISFVVNSKIEKIDTSIEVDYLLREEQIGHTIEEREKKN